VTTTRKKAAWPFRILIIRADRVRKTSLPNDWRRAGPTEMRQSHEGRKSGGARHYGSNHERKPESNGASGRGNKESAGSIACKCDEDSVPDRLEIGCRSKKPQRAQDCNVDIEGPRDRGGRNRSCSISRRSSADGRDDGEQRRESEKRRELEGIAQRTVAGRRKVTTGKEDAAA
jgi:hypothetical protein